MLIEPPSLTISCAEDLFSIADGLSYPSKVVCVIPSSLCDSVLRLPDPQNTAVMLESFGEVDNQLLAVEPKLKRLTSLLESSKLTLCISPGVQCSCMSMSVVRGQTIGGNIEVWDASFFLFVDTCDTDNDKSRHHIPGQTSRGPT